MNNPLKWAVAALWVLPMIAGAADDAKKAPTQHERMANCSKEAHAKALKGDERRKFMSTCLSSGKHAKAAHPSKSTA